jgi:glycosyltransferase involved in cell wall biosynthesis
MRIVIWHPEPTQTGAVSSEMQMIMAYCRRFPDDNVTIICAAGSPLVELESLRNCHVEVVGRYIPREFYFFGALDFALWRFGRRQSFDVFLSTNTGLYFRGKVPQVLSVTNAFQVSSRKNAVLHPHSVLRVLLLRWCFKRALRASSAVIVQTPLMGRYLREIPECPKKVIVIPKAVVADGENFERVICERIAQRLEGTESDAKLLYVATSYPHKNHQILAGMMNQFRQKGTAVRLIVTISPEEWKKVAGNAADGLVESGHVIPLGWVNKDDLEPLYRVCDLCVMPSLLESLSSANIEAMFWKKPQIVADLPYAHDLCGDAAWYASPHDSSAWFEQVERLLQNEPMRQELVVKGLKRLEAFPRSWDEMVESMRNTLAEVVVEAGRRVDTGQKLK